MSNSDVCFLVLARPADGLAALTREVIGCSDDAFCHSVYDVIAALLRLGSDQPVILITRPSRLAKPHLAATLQTYPNLRLVGWLGPDEPLDDPAVAAQTGVTVGSREELTRVIAAIRNTFAGEPIFPDLKGPEPDTRLDPADYRLSGEELDALLGAG